MHNTMLYEKSDPAFLVIHEFFCGVMSVRKFFPVLEHVLQEHFLP